MPGRSVMRANRVRGTARGPAGTTRRNAAHRSIETIMPLAGRFGYDGTRALDPDLTALCSTITASRPMSGGAESSAPRPTGNRE